MASQKPDRFPVALILVELDYMLLDNYWRKFQVYSELGWDENSIHAFLQNKSNRSVLAAFNTKKANFTAPNRRDQYEKLFNRPDMIEKDVAIPGSVEIMQMLAEGMYVVVLSSRPAEQQDKTMKYMKCLGFPVENMEFFFKTPNESVMNFRNRCFALLQKRFLVGFGVCLTTSDTIGFDRIKFPTIGLTTLKDRDELIDSIENVCEDWNEIAVSLTQMLRTLPRDKLKDAQAHFNASSKSFGVSNRVASLAAKFEEAGGLFASTGGQNPFATRTEEIPPTPMVEQTPEPRPLPEPIVPNACEDIQIPMESPKEMPAPVVQAQRPQVDVGDLARDLLKMMEESSDESVPAPILEGPSVFDKAEARSQTQNMLDQAVFFQLFSGSGSDTILGPDAQTSIQIENVEMLLNAFMAELKPRLDMIPSGQINEFFAYFTQRFQLDLSEVQIQVETNIAGMVGLEGQEDTTIYIAITKLIERLRNITFEHFGIGWIAWLYYETVKQPFEGPAKEKFNQLSADNDPEIGLLHNVSFILWLMHLYPDMPYSEPIKAIIQTHAQKIIARLF
jgi:hypothetical protein